ncbi:MAG: Lon protease 1 [Mycoplasmataceae bacterium]|nr:MAG: Lon protease 1 [Mycoplasmataceae bacterium]
MTELPILLLDSFFLFPNCENYLSLETDDYLKKVILQAWKNCDGYLLIIPSKEKFSDKSEQFSPIGTLAKINLDIPSKVDADSIINSLVGVQLQGLERIKVTNLEKREQIWHGNYQILSEKKMNERELNELTEKFVRHLPDILEKSKFSSVGKLPYMTMMSGNISTIIDFIVQNSKEIDNQIKWKFLATANLDERLTILIGLPNRQKIDKELDEETQKRIKKEQEEYYLQKKSEAIRKKLKESRSHNNKEASKYLERLEKEPFPKYVKNIVKEELERYESMPSNYGESNIVKQYIDWLMNLPWYQKTKEIKDLEFARQKLDEKHYGLFEIKERIIEYLAAQQRAEKTLGQVICLVGPPGVGKTSLAYSVAEATGRKFVSVSMGGIRDVSEIQGHRRTYIGAMPGRIVQAMKKVQVINPCFLIDEVDKISSDYRGDPVYALLEMLDPNQNKKFIDNYLGEEVPYNLSEVMFICTANDERDLPLPLLDRMEIIHLSSYTEKEKFHIAKDYLIPENLKKHNLSSKEIKFEDQAIDEIIRYYTREAGVRELDRKIQKIVHKFIVQLLQNKKKKLLISQKNLVDYLKKKDYEFTSRQKKSQTGVVTGLAWTGYGGDILPIEVNLVTGKGELGRLTGSLGEVMKESAEVAFSYVQSYLEENKKIFKKELILLKKRDINVHAPEGAVKKDGPSAGIALTTAILSALTNQKIPADIGMTGEITSKGKVLGIGGLKEKAIAAHRSELKTIIIPKANEKDIEDIPEEIRQKLEIILVEEYEEVWKKIFVKANSELKKNIIPIKKRQETKAQTNS